jgi:hypothetical protein
LRQTEQREKQFELQLMQAETQQVAADRKYELDLRRLEMQNASEQEKRKLAQDKQILDAQLKAQQIAAQQAAQQHQRVMAEMQQELQRMKKEEVEAAMRASAEAREAQQRLQRATAEMQTEKISFEREKQRLDGELQRTRLDFEKAKLQRETAKAEADALRAEREAMIKERAQAWQQIVQQFDMRLKEGESYDKRRITEAELEHKRNDRTLATRMTNILAQCAVIVQNLTHAEDFKDINVEMYARGDPEQMEINVNESIEMATTFKRYLESAYQIATDTEKILRKVCADVVPPYNSPDPRTLPRLRDMAAVVANDISQIRGEMTELSKPRRETIENKEERAVVNRIFSNGSFSEMVRWFTGAALNNPMAKQRVAMWYQKAQLYEARYYVARAVLLAISEFLKSQKNEPRYAGKDYRGPELPEGGTYSFMDRRNALLDAWPIPDEWQRPLQLKRGVSVEEEMTDALARPPHIRSVTGAASDKLQKAKKPKKKTKRKAPKMTGDPSDRIDTRRAQQLQMTIDNIIDGIRQRVANLSPELMWGDASPTAFGDFGALQQYTQDWALMIREKFQGIGVQSPEGSVITAILAVIEAFDKAADKVEASFKLFDQKFMMTELTKQMDKLVSAARAIRNEQDDGFYKINQAIYDACLYWNEFFPFMIIDQLTAGWAAVQSEVLDLVVRGGSADDVWNVLLKYDQTIDDQFLRYNETLTSTSAKDQYMRGSPLIQRTVKEVDRQSRIEKQRDTINKQFNLWYNEASSSSKNASKVIRAIVSMTKEMTYMVGAEVAEPSEQYFGNSPFSTQNVDRITNWLKEWQDSAKDGYKRFQAVYQQLAKAVAALSDTDDARERQNVNTEDTYEFVKVANVVTICVEDLKRVQQRAALRLKEWREVLSKTAAAPRALLNDYKEVENKKDYLVPYLSKAEEWTSAAIAAYLDAQRNLTEAKLAKQHKDDKKAGGGNANDAGLDAGLPSYGVSKQMLLFQSSRPGWRFARVLDFAKLMAGAVPVVVDSIVDMSVILVGHPEVRKEAIFADIADGTAEKETAALRLMQGTASVHLEKELKAFPAPEAFGGALVDPAAQAEAKEAQEADDKRVARIGEAILNRINEMRDALMQADTFEEALMGILTPYGAASVLASWHMLQKSSRLYEKRSLAQMICVADIKLRTKFAQFCANQYNATDKRRPTRHAHGIDFANEINVEYEALGKFMIAQVRLNPKVRDADDFSESPWIICRATA